MDSIMEMISIRTNQTLGWKDWEDEEKNGAVEEVKREENNVDASKESL